MSNLVYGGLCTVPVTDINYKSYLSRATDAELELAISIMKAEPKGHKVRIGVCERELKDRAERQRRASAKK